MSKSSVVRGDLTLDRHQIATGPRKGEAVFLPQWKEDGVNLGVNLAAMQFLAVHGDVPDGTRATMFDALSHLHVAAELYGIEDFEHRLSYGIGLSRGELLALNTALKYQLRGLRKILHDKRNGIAILDVDRAIASVKPMARTSEGPRKSNAIRYLRWLMQTGDAVLSNYVVPESEIEKRRAAFLDIRECIKPPKSDSGRRVSRFTSSDLVRLRQAVTTYHPDAIWKDEFTAMRNSVILDLMYYGGLRRSEILCLYNSDIMPRHADSPGEIRIEDRRNDPSDPRSPPPAAKTGKGVITVPDFVFDRIEAYQRACVDIRNHAEDLGLVGNLRHRFLIISGWPSVPESYGAPLSVSGLNFVFRSFLEGAGLTDQQFAGLSPHALRHLCAMEYVRRRRSQGATDEQIHHDMKQYFRWAVGSTMPAYYTAAQINADLYRFAQNDAEQRRQSIDNAFLESL